MKRNPMARFYQIEKVKPQTGNPTACVSQTANNRLLPSPEKSMAVGIMNRKNLIPMIKTANI